MDHADPNRLEQTCITEHSSSKTAPDQWLRQSAPRSISLPSLPPFRIHTHLGGDRYISAETATAGAWEPLETELIRRLLPRYDLFLDVGANIGWYTLVAGLTLRARGTVHAFEPDPANFGLLETNVAANRRANVRLHQAAVADRCGHGSAAGATCAGVGTKLSKGDEAPEFGSRACPLPASSSRTGSSYRVHLALLVAVSHRRHHSIFRRAVAFLGPTENHLGIIVVSTLYHPTIITR